MKLWKMKKSSGSDHEIMNLVEQNVGTPAILGRALHYSRSLVGVQYNSYIVFKKASYPLKNLSLTFWFI
jgi:hypothetical protein